MKNFIAYSQDGIARDASPSVATGLAFGTIKFEDESARQEPARASPFLNVEVNRISGCVGEEVANVSPPRDLSHPTCAHNTPLWEGLVPTHTGPR